MKYLIFSPKTLKLAKIYLWILGIIVTMSCTQQEYTDEDASVSSNITPTPERVLKRNGYFTLNKEVKVSADFSDSLQNKLVASVVKSIKKEIGHTLKVEDIYRTKSKFTTIRFELNAEVNQNDQSYELIIEPSQIVIRSQSYQGLYFGNQSLIFLINQNKLNKPIKVPAMSVLDEPVIEDRVVFLSVSRIADIELDVLERLLTEMSLYKLNHLIIDINDESSSEDFVKILQQTEDNQVAVTFTEGSMKSNNELIIGSILSINNEDSKSILQSSMTYPIYINNTDTPSQEQSASTPTSNIISHKGISCYVNIGEPLDLDNLRQFAEFSWTGK